MTSSVYRESGAAWGGVGARDCFTLWRRGEGEEESEGQGVFEVRVWLCVGSVWGWDVTGKWGMRVRGGRCWESV